MRKLLSNTIEVFINYFVAYIPFWTIRKLFYRAFGMKIGKGSRINQRVYILCPRKITIGMNTMINSFAILDGRGGLEIGDSVSISMRAIIYSAAHYSNSDCFEYYSRKTLIGNYAWICVNAVVLAGTVIADGVIVSANTVIKGKTEKSAVYMGIPAQFVRTRAASLDYKLNNKNYFI